jgi:hypothetical protein
MIARIKGRWGNTQILLLHDGWGPNGHSPRALGGASCPVTKPSGSRASSAVHCRPDEAANPNVTAVAGIPKITWPLRAFLSASCLESERGRAFRSLRSGRARSTKRDLRTTARWKGCRVTVPVGGAPSTGLARAFVKRLRDSPSVAIGDAAVGIEASPRSARHGSPSRRIATPPTRDLASASWIARHPARSGPYGARVAGRLTDGY